jgi:peptidoglycan/LPS O-acetylase OafA/YrhL
MHDQGMARVVARTGDVITTQRVPADAVRAATLADRPATTHIRGLDGLRAVAVLSVLAYHAGLPWLPGGFLGVDLFFVISGFLITTLLLHERQRSGRISLGRFYVRRARRLLPVLFTMLVAVAGFLSLCHRNDLRQARGDIAAAAGYFSNWWYVLHHRPYFVAAGREPPLQHLWSLAVEEQFYLVWPLLLIVITLVRARLRRVLVLALAGAAASAVWMYLLSVRGNVPFDTDSSRVYFGTDTHATALLLGAAAAALMLAAARRRGDAEPATVTRALAFVAGLAALVAVCLAMHRATEASGAVYRWGFAAFALAGVVLVVAVALPGNPLAAVLDTQPLRWVGTRSYGLYLWHWPIFVYTRPGLDWPLHGAAALAARLAITAACTELSFRFVERPIRERGLAGWWSGVREWRGHPAHPSASVLVPLPRGATAYRERRRFDWRPIAPVLGAVLGTVMVVGSTAFLASHAIARARHDASTLAAPTSPAPVVPPPVVSSPPVTATPSRTPTPTPDAVASAPSSPSHTATPTHAAATHPAAKPSVTAPAGVSATTPPAISPGPPPPVSAVGDSVMIDAEVALQQDCPGSEVYAVVGWQAKPMFAELDALRAANHLGAIVIVEAGTNGAVSPTELDALLTSLADRTKVVVVNDHMDRPWAAPNNAMFPQVVKNHPNAVVADWDSLAAQHPDWLTSDGVHLQPAGRGPYADMLKAAAGC